MPTMVWSKERIIQKIYWAVDHYGHFNPQQYSQIASVLQKLNSAEVFEILYTVLTNVDRPATRFADQQFAGRLLLDLEPMCTLELTDAIQGLLKCYNLSIEQVPWYFAQQYGKQVVLEILEKLRTELTCKQQQQSIEKWEWWLQACKD
ncbi:hypothetical protein [Trichocoleus sp. FACHB-69]|uniref:hypothetical protein n=2 Tax=Cyanophyceae TaxID=3028117 RepID=UPI001A7E37DF|nr:hypothetical protein [Trichocoleus sp. FACHB-69]